MGGTPMTRGGRLVREGPWRVCFAVAIVPVGTQCGALVVPICRNHDNWQVWRGLGWAGTRRERLKRISRNLRRSFPTGFFGAGAGCGVFFELKWVCGLGVFWGVILRSVAHLCLLCSHSKVGTRRRGSCAKANVFVNETIVAHLCLLCSHSTYHLFSALAVDGRCLVVDVRVPWWCREMGLFSPW